MLENTESDQEMIDIGQAELPDNTQDNDIMDIDQKESVDHPKAAPPQLATTAQTGMCISVIAD